MFEEEEKKILYIFKNILHKTIEPQISKQTGAYDGRTVAKKLRFYLIFQDFLFEPGNEPWNCSKPLYCADSIARIV